MPKPKKGGTKTTMNLTEFTGEKNTGDALAWAEDDWGEEEEEFEQGGEGGAKHASMYGRKAGAMGDFRSEAAVQLSTVVPDDMEAPFVGYIGNLPNLTDEQLEDQFADQFSVLGASVVKKPKTNFGYLEVSSREELQSLVLQTGRNIMGRKIRVDVASPQQIERFKGGAQQGGFNGFSRDDLGQSQPEFKQRSGMRGSSSVGDFSRDAMGEQQAEGGRGGMGGFGAMGSADDLGDFRSQTVAQPDFKPMNERGAGRGNWRGGSNNSSKPASPNDAAPPSDFGNWRDGPVQAQPEVPSGESADKKPKWGAKKREGGGDKGGEGKRMSPSDKKPAGGGESGGGFGSWRDEAPAKQPEPASEEKPAEKKPAWGPKKTIAQKPSNNGSAKKPAQQPASAAGGMFAALGRK